ncbi:hypothetical protein [Streptomyces stelliscabiei]|uniref:hypothetical protein n=1 Tax=Streptomyces stelliscabiei TaxID=146820 RepID=UPI002FEE8278
MKNDGSVIKTAHIIAADGWEVDLPLWTDAADCGPGTPATTHTDDPARRAPRASATPLEPDGPPG